MDSKPKLNIYLLHQWYSQVNICYSFCVCAFYIVLAAVFVHQIPKMCLASLMLCGLFSCNFGLLWQRLHSELIHCYSWRIIILRCSINLEAFVFEKISAKLTELLFMVTLIMFVLPIPIFWLLWFRIVSWLLQQVLWKCLKDRSSKTEFVMVTSTVY